MSTFDAPMQETSNSAMSLGMTRRRLTTLAVSAALAAPFLSLAKSASAQADVQFPTEFPDLVWPEAVNEPTEKVSISVAHAWDPQTLARQELFNTLFSERHPNIEIKPENTPWADFRQKYVIQGAGGSLPDIMYVHFSWGAQLIQNEFLHALDDHIAAQADFVLDDFVPTSLLSYTGRDDGALYALPYDEAPGVLFYNKDIFDAAGVAYPSADWTQDTLKETAIALTSGEGAERIYGFGGMDLGPDTGHMAPAYLLPRGGAYTNPEETESRLATDETIAAFEWWMELLTEHKAMPTLADRDAAQVDPLTLGRVAMDITGAWFVRSMIQDADFNWDVAPWPAGPVAHTTFSAGSAFAITRDTENAEAAWIYLNEMQSTAGQTIMGGSTGLFTPTRKSVSAAYIAAFESLYGNANIGQVISDSLGFASGEILRSAVAAEVTQMAGSIWDLVANGDMSVGDGLKQIDSQIAPLLAQNG